MTCKKLEKYDRGKMDEADFKLHAASCPSCREALLLDEDVMTKAKSLRQPVDSPLLWNRIEETLQKEMAEEQRLSTELQAKKERRRKQFILRWKFAHIIPTAFILLAVVGLGTYIGLRDRTPHSGLLAHKALIRIEQKEQEYMKSIQDLEKQVIPRIADLDLELAFLYRERLETIDAQITQCREALVSNPTNAHIRHYLITALQDKRETLVDVLNLKTGKINGT